MNNKKIIPQKRDYSEIMKTVSIRKEKLEHTIKKNKQETTSLSVISS